MIELSIVLPIHNEEKDIAVIVRNINNLLTKSKIDFEILCIENGSIDNSYNLLKSLSKAYKHVKVYKSNKGWGNAVRLGIKVAKGKYLCYMVSDNQVDPKNILRVYKIIKGNNIDLVKVRRRNRENLIRSLNSKFYNLLCLLVFGFDRDINGTPKIIKSFVLRNMKLRSENVALDLELLLKLRKGGYKWIDIPVESKKRNWGMSTTNIKTAIEMVKHIIRFKCNLF